VLGKAVPELPVVMELVAEGREGERFDQVLRNAGGNGLADNRQLPDGGHGDDLHGQAGTADSAQNVQSVQIRQVHIQQHQIDGDGGLLLLSGGQPQERQGLRTRARHTRELETVDPPDILRMGGGCHGFVFDHEDADRIRHWCLLIPLPRLTGPDAAAATR
jgi:hypothetical protein